MTSQHFLLSANRPHAEPQGGFPHGRGCGISRRSAQLRWPENDGEAMCPRCGCVETYNITSRRRFKCVACHHQFSVTSGTIFASRKLSFTDLLAAIVIFVNGAKGVSALQVSRDLDVQYKTAFVLSHKLREAMAREHAEPHAERHGRDRWRVFRRLREAGERQGRPQGPSLAREPHRQAPVRRHHARARWQVAPVRCPH